MFTGSGHNLVSLEDVVAELSKETTGLREKAQQKYEELSSMLKQITMDVADFDTETEETIAEIRKARDEQVWQKNKLCYSTTSLQSFSCLGRVSISKYIECVELIVDRYIGLIFVLKIYDKERTDAMVYLR